MRRRFKRKALKCKLGKHSRGVRCRRHSDTYRALTAMGYTRRHRVLRLDDVDRR